MVSHVRETLGPIDTLVLNAPTSSGSASEIPAHQQLQAILAPFTGSRWDVLEAFVCGQLQAAYYPSQAVLPDMIKYQRGSIIFVSATHARQPEAGGIAVSVQELWQLAQDQGLPILDMTEAEHITQVFDGWIMGILLGTRLGNLQWLNAEAADLPFLSGALQPVPQKDRVTLTIPEQRLRLFFSLVQELFQPTPDAYHFLKEAAILEEMTPALCNALFEIDDASERLSFLM